ncbi:AAA family ATPase [Mastigocoleus sp. MO_188.B34]|uniref:AAA family ATPase n=1 Tax=Mastigocoleus sp. MO_188.B34 TaxID=3036635 RepID=UPI00262A30FD|nr:AAA family ATPase [Mastigocoleus sp. MO_188.B34]MDJ0696210.1 AAA family ATPase [Mastigocoleus sp. MO_188.B34]
MEKLSHLLIVGSLTLGVGITASLVGSSNGVLLGSTTGAIIGAGISSKLEDRKEQEAKIQLEQLKTQVLKQEEWEKVKAELPILKARVTQLRKFQQSLATVEGEFVQKKAELQQVERNLINLKQRKEELEQRISTINQEPPNLSELEKLQSQVKQFRLDKAGLEGEINALRSQIEPLEEEKQKLQYIESEYNVKTAQLGALDTNIQELQTKYQQLEQNLTNIKQQKEELERRVAILNQEYPNLSELEQLQSQVKQFRLDKASLEGEIHSLRSQVEYLAGEKKNLEGIESEYNAKKTQLDTLNINIQELQTKSQQLEQNLTNIKQEKEEIWRRLSTIKQQEPRLLKLEELQSKIEQYRLEKAGLEGEINALGAQRQNLQNIESEYNAKKAQINVLNTNIQELQAKSKKSEQNLINLKQKKEELEQRISAINQKQPSLVKLEELQSRIEQFRLEKAGLEGEINALRSQIKTLTEQKQKLQAIESEYNAKTAKLDVLNTSIQELQAKSQQLEQRASELELLRATYDGLFNEKENFESRVNQLRPQIDRLEAEKQRILQAIQQNQQEYQRVEELKQKLRNLNHQIRDKDSQLRELDREKRNLNGIKATLEEGNASLKQEKEQIQEEINILRGEIGNLENSSKVALRSLKQKLWSNLPKNKQNIATDSQGEKVFLENFTEYIKQQGLVFPRRVINAFHTSLKVQDISALVILAGISGTGKSELPQRYADYIGAQKLTLAVQPRWDSPQDLQGFYNYVEKKFKPTDLMRGLYQYNHESTMRDRMVIVLLDEMNLARVEYYFSDFLSKLETRRSHDTYLEIDVGSLPIQDNQRRLRIPKEFLFVGTMNEDESTQSLSDKVLDRANVITFGKPQYLQLRQSNSRKNNSTTSSEYLAYSDFKQWIKTPVSDSNAVNIVKEYLNITNNIMAQMGHPFAHRVYQGITQYVVNYPGVEDNNTESFQFAKIAIADQFGQKILPKLRGLMIDDFQEQLDELEKIIEEIGDESLTQAFKKAREGRYGQFHWQGLVYQEESV